MLVRFERVEFSDSSGNTSDILTDAEDTPSVPLESEF